MVLEVNTTAAGLVGKPTAVAAAKVAAAALAAAAAKGTAAAFAAAAKAGSLQTQISIYQLQ